MAYLFTFEQFMFTYTSYNYFNVAHRKTGAMSTNTFNKSVERPANRDKDAGHDAKESVLTAESRGVEHSRGPLGDPATITVVLKKKRECVQYSGFELRDSDMHTRSAVHWKASPSQLRSLMGTGAVVSIS
jgi:hypothetical protein